MKYCRNCGRIVEIKCKCDKPYLVDVDLYPEWIKVWEEDEKETCTRQSK